MGPRASQDLRSPSLIMAPATKSCNLHKCGVKNLTIFKFEPTTPNMSQHIATPRNMVAKHCGRAGLNVDRDDTILDNLS